MQIWKERERFRRTEDLYKPKRKAGHLKKRNGTEQCNLIIIHGQPDIIISVPCLKS